MKRIIFSVFTSLAFVYTAFAQSSVYVQDFSANPGFSLATPASGGDSYTWDSSLGIYRVYLTETVALTNKFALSPQFTKVQASSFVIQVDIKPVSVSYGMGIGMIFYDSDVGLSQSINQGKYVWINANGSDSPKFYLIDGNGHGYSSAAPAMGTWYTVKIAYASSTGKADITITNKSTGAIFYQQTGVTFNPVSFNRIGLGAATSAGDGTSAEMHYDNISVIMTQSVYAQDFSANPGLITSVHSPNVLPAAFVLDQNYPNPFNPSTTIAFELPEATKVSLRIFTTMGQIVGTLVDGFKEPGHYQFQWNANVASGIYFYRLQAGEFVDTKKMILLH
jgi:hypothetical protein